MTEIARIEFTDDPRTTRCLDSSGELVKDVQAVRVERFINSDKVKVFVTMRLRDVELVGPPDTTFSIAIKEQPEIPRGFSV